MPLRRVLVLVAFLALTVSTQASVRPLAPQGNAGVARLLTALESSLAAGDDRVRALESPTLPAVAAALLDQARAPVVAIRERQEIARASGYDVLADTFTARGVAGRLTTWRLTLEPKSTSPGEYLVGGLEEQASLDNLVNLSLDGAHQFSIHDLALSGTDLTLTMTSGTAFTAASTDGVTALVLRGRGEVTFSPPDPAEQGQMKIFAKATTLHAGVDEVFVRLNPAEFAARVAAGGLVAMPMDPAELSRARPIFDRFARQSYNIDLHDFGQTGWSLQPAAGQLIVEFRTSRHGWLTYTRTPSDPEDVTLFQRASNHLVCSYTSADRRAARGPGAREVDEAPYEVEHEELDLTFDPARQWIHGRGALLMRVKTEHLSSVMIRLDDALTVSSVTSPGFDRLLAVRITGQPRVLVSLPGALPRGAEFVIDVAYDGRLAPQPFDREAMPDPPQTVASGLAQDDVETFRPDPEPLVIYSGRQAWYPQTESSDHATATMRLTAPAEFAMAASGTLVRSTLKQNGEARSLRSNDYIADRPVRYLACVMARLSSVGRGRALVPSLSAAAGEATTEPSSSTVNLEVLATPREVGPARQFLPHVEDIVRFYGSTFGGAPYPDLTVIAADDNLPGGHSPAYLSIWRQRLSTSPYGWGGDNVAFDGTPFFLLAHEIAHQWWGQAVGWSTYHDQWISEGLAQYSAALYIGSSLGADAMDRLLATMCQSAEDNAGEGPIALGYRLGHLENDPRIFRAIVYNKAAVVLHMLRRLMGDDAFFAGLTRFYRDHRFGSADTNAFRAAFQAETPIALSRFFDRWIAGSGLPSFDVTSRVEPGGAGAVIRVEQIGDVYDFPLTVTIEYADGHRDRVTVPVTAAVVEHRIPLTGPVRRIVTRDPLTPAVERG